MFDVSEDLTVEVQLNVCTPCWQDRAARTTP